MPTPEKIESDVEGRLAKIRNSKRNTLFNAPHEETIPDFENRQGELAKTNAYLEHIETRLRQYLKTDEAKRLEELGGKYHAEAEKIAARPLDFKVSPLALGFGVRWGNNMSAVNKTLAGTAALGLPAIIEPTVFGEILDMNRSLKNMGVHDNEFHPYHEVMSQVFNGNLEHANTYAAILDHYHKQLNLNDRLELSNSLKPTPWQNLFNIGVKIGTIRPFMALFDVADMIGNKTLAPAYQKTLALRHGIEVARTALDRRALWRWAKMQWKNK